jgi:hypothetical protein
MAIPLALPAGIWRRTDTVALIAVTLLGLALRGLPALVHEWPVRDGGLFWQMTGELVASDLRLPAFTGYNHAAIPFAYPPLAFYIAAVLELATPLPRELVFRVIPITFATLAVPGVALIARELLPTSRQAVVAAGLYAVIPTAFQIHVTGGGLPRSMAFLLALLAIWSGFRLLRLRQMRHVVLTGVLAGLAAMTHPQSTVAIAIALGAALIAWFSVRRTLLLVAAAGISLICAAPWIAVVVERHGFEPFVAAVAVPRRDIVSSVVGYLFVFLAATPMIAVLDLFGHVRELARTHFQLVIWRVGVFGLDLRYSPVIGAVPVALLATVGLAHAGPIAAALIKGNAGRAGDVVVTIATLGLAVAVVLPGARLTVDLASPGGALSRADRAALEWVRANTEPGTEFLVLHGTQPWGSDDVAEWFPALTDRVSVATKQGYEWIGLLVSRSAADDELRLCQPDDLTCVERWLERHAVGGGVGLYLTGSESSGGRCCGTLMDQVRASGRYVVVHEAPGAVVAMPRGPGTAMP